MAGKETVHSILSSFSDWPEKQREELAAILLVMSCPKFHGSKTIHYNGGQATRIVDNKVRDLNKNV